MPKNSSTPMPVELITAILLAAVLIAGSLVFLGWQFRPQQPQASSPAFVTEQAKEALKQEILAEIRTQAAPQTDSFVPGAAAPAADSAGAKADILAEIRSAEFMDPLIDAGIQRYVARQQEAQVNARAEQERLAREKAANVPPVDPAVDHIYGNPDAAISLIEYSDFECPYCKSYHPNPKQVVAESDGAVNWVHRHYPLAFHNPGAQKQAEAAECAAELGGTEAFWQYVDAVYERTTSGGQGFPLENLAPLAEELGLDGDLFRECLDTDRHAQRVKDDLANATASGITGTPGTIIRNNQTGEVRLASGALPVSQLQAIVRELLAQE